MRKKNNNSGLKDLYLNTNKKTDRTEQKPVLDLQLKAYIKKH